MGLSQDEVNQRVMQAVDFVGLDHALLENHRLTCPAVKNAVPPLQA